MRSPRKDSLVQGGFLFVYTNNYCENFSQIPYSVVHAFFKILYLFFHTKFKTL